MSNTDQSRTSYERPPDSPIGGNHVIEIARGPRHFKLQVDGHDVPYIRLGICEPDWVIDSYGLGGLVKNESGTWHESQDVKWASDDVYQHAIHMRQAIERGEPLYILVLDDRFATEPVPESEINRWAWFMANAMAVSAGYTSHGKGSRPINRHGPSRV